MTVFQHNARLAAILAVPLLLAACGEGAEGDEGGAAEGTAGQADAGGAAGAVPEAGPVDPGNWAITTEVWKVEGEGLDAETARAMRGQKAETAICVDRAGAQRSYVALVEGALGTECQQTGTAAEDPQTGSDTPRLRGTLSCRGGDGQEAPASFVVDDLQGGHLAGSLERTATAPDGSGQITMFINVEATRTGDCS